MAAHSSTLAWKIPWTEEPGRLQSMGSLGVGHDWVTSLSLLTFMHWRRKWQPTPVFLPGESQGRGAWWAAVSGAAQSRTRLRRLSSSSSHRRLQLVLYPQTPFLLILFSRPFTHSRVFCCSGYLSLSCLRSGGYETQTWTIRFSSTPNSEFKF